jgi:uncharacterized protein
MGEAGWEAGIMSAQSDANRATIMAFFAANDRGEDALPFLADDATWWVPGHWALGGTYRKDELGKVFERVFALMDVKPRFVVHAVTAEEDRVAVDCAGSGRFADGEPFEQTYHFLFRLRDGKIVEAKEFMNTAYVDKVLGTRLAAAAA